MQKAKRVEQRELPTFALRQKRHQAYSVEQPWEQQVIYIRYVGRFIRIQQHVRGPNQGAEKGG